MQKWQFHKIKLIINKQTTIIFILIHQHFTADIFPVAKFQILATSKLNDDLTTYALQK